MNMYVSTSKEVLDSAVSMKEKEDHLAVCRGVMLYEKFVGLGERVELRSMLTENY